MYDVSTAYKESMKNPLRNHSYMRVILGIINLEAQSSAEITEHPEVTGYSDPQSVLEKNDIGNVYATYEQDFFKADGSMFFLPRDVGEYHKNGIVTNNLFSEDMEFTITFVPSDIRGLTIQFGENYPTLFTVSTSSGYEIEFENENSYFQTDVIFELITSITIKIKKTSKENGRLRIYYIKLGVVTEYDNEWIISAESSALVSMINETLPEHRFSVVLKNEDLRFNPDNPDSEINFLEPGQPLSVIYGYEVDDNDIEWMQLCALYVSEWSANDTQATISSVDRLQYMSGNYYKGKYYSNGISLFDLAEDVFEDAGINSSDYALSDYLKSVTVNNPLPNVTHKEALQIIANAGRCLLGYDRYGKINMYPAFVPDFEISTNGAEYFSDIQNIDKDYFKYVYASYQKDYWTADGKMYFAPHFGIQDAGYASSAISGESCLFETNPKITQIFEMPYECYGVRIVFANNIAEDFVVRTFLDEQSVDTITFEENYSEQVEIMQNFSPFNKIEIEFFKTQYPYQRIQVNQITLGPDTDYKVEYDDLFSTPTGTQLQKVKNLKAGRTIYSSGSQQQDLSSDTITYDGENKIYYFSEPSYNYSVSIEEGEGSASIVASGAYFVEIKFSGITVGNQIKFSIKGYKYNLSTSYHAITINNRGNDMIWENPLISNAEHCKDVGEWLSEYEQSEIEYELDFRGEPAIDVGDTIFQENKYVENLKVVVEEHQMSFKTGGAISGALRTRRKERVARAENKLGKYRLL